MNSNSETELKGPDARKIAQRLGFWDRDGWEREMDTESLAFREKGARPSGRKPSEMSLARTAGKNSAESGKG